MESRVAGCADHGVGGRLGTLVFARARSTSNGASEAPVMATQLDPATQLDDSASERRAATPSTVRGESPMSTPAKKQRLSGLEFSPAKENAYKVVPSPAQSSKSEPVRPGPPTRLHCVTTTVGRHSKEEFVVTSSCSLYSATRFATAAGDFSRRRTGWWSRS